MHEFDVFISYCTADSQPPKIAAFLEQNGLRCWIAPRNIAPGTPYARAIIDGMEHSRVFLVFISSSSIKSEDVLNEIDNAHRMRKTIIPVFIERVEMSREFGYYLNKTQWINVFNDSRQQKEQLLETLRDVLGSAPTPASDPSRQKDSNKHKGASSSSRQTEGNKDGFSFKAIYKNKGCLVMVSLCVVAIIMIPVFFSMSSDSNPAPSSAAETPVLAENEDKPSVETENTEAPMPTGEPTEVLGRRKPDNFRTGADERQGSQPQQKSEKAQSAQETSEGTLSMGYGSWQGGIRNGKPHGKGRLTFSSAHKVDRSSSHEASPGDYFIATYEDGMLVSGKLYDGTGTLIATIIP